MPGALNGMEAHIVKIFGERNTGTRAMAALVRQVPSVSCRLRRNTAAPVFDGAVEAAIEAQMRGDWKRLYLHAVRDDLADQAAQDDPWKHALPRLTPAMRAARVKTILLVRNPYSWLVGLARRPYHMKGPKAQSLEDFAARPWMTERREGLPAVVASPLDLWSRKMAGCVAYRAEAHRAGLTAEIVRFEAFVRNPGTVAATALEDLGIEGAPLAVAAENTKEHEPELSVLQRYYAEEMWRSRLTYETVARVNARVDWQVATALGYLQLDPRDFPKSLPPEEEEAMRAEMSSLSAPSHRAQPALSHGKTGAAAAT